MTAISSSYSGISRLQSVQAKQAVQAPPPAVKGSQDPDGDGDNDAAGAGAADTDGRVDVMA